MPMSGTGTKEEQNPKDVVKEKLHYIPPRLLKINSEEEIAGGMISLQEADPNGGPAS